MHALQLNADYLPMKVVRWERAVEMVLEGTAITERAFEGRYVRSASLALPWPAVIVLRRYTRVSGRMKFSPKNVFARDRHTCGYCGYRPMHAGRPVLGELSVDHVVPRAHNDSGAVYLPWSKKWVNVTCWENATTACRRCNQRKADRTPVQAGMALRALPRVPTAADVVRMQLQRVVIVPEWCDYIPAGWGDTAIEDTSLTAAR